MADYLPNGEPSLVIWLGNYQAKLATYGATLGLEPIEMTVLSKTCTHLSILINNTEAAKTALKNAVATKNAVKASNIALIRIANNKMKTSDAYTDAIEEIMGIKGGSRDINRETATPKFSGEAFPWLCAIEVFQEWFGWSQHLFEAEGARHLDLPGKRYQLTLR